MRDTRREKEPTRHKDCKLHERCLHSIFRSRLPINRLLYSLNDTSFVKVDRVCVYSSRFLFSHPNNEMYSNDRKENNIFLIIQHINIGCNILIPEAQMCK